jgi:hypothetical protein
MATYSYFGDDWDVKYFVRPSYRWFPFVWYDLWKEEQHKYILQGGGGVVNRTSAVKVAVSYKEAYGFYKLMQD